MEIKRSADVLVQARADSISPEAAGSLPGLFAERVRRSPHAIAYREFDRGKGRWRDFAWRELERPVADPRAALAAAGLQPGDRVAIALPNGVGWVTFDLAALSLGAVVVPLYLHDSAANMAFILADSGARVLIIDLESRWATLAAHHGQLAELEQVWIEAPPAAVEERSRPAVRAVAEVLAARTRGWPATASSQTRSPPSSTPRARRGGRRASRYPTARCSGMRTPWCA